MPLGYLYVTGRGTIWAPALVHTAIDSFKLVIIPPAATPSFSLLLVAFSLVVPLLVLVIPRSARLGRIDFRSDERRRALL